MAEIVIETLTLEEKVSLLKDLKEAYFSGASRVRFRERDVTYRSAVEMKKIIDQLEGSIVIRPKRRVILTTFGGGYR
ncbi:protein of unknown function [Pseudorhizobium banfieldiae]|uniref:Uncharacterized protein n=1 Tax=Pseudorhizobium banfieldiae TaxID=1125847 RepID=L0NE68_9HYPH|nr:hypothetical protein [Pseudorhizobium banfieldiae]CAD6606197.1 hypothetical protein RNT25_01809 [arsenite-oxidising bacterium NT-25]CCF19154.1 protein of unknown function [Pseudorhizobium banfieldiae]